MHYYLLGGVILGCTVWGYLFYRLKKSVLLFAKEWDLRNKQVPGSDALVYVVLGDSTAQGIGTNSISKSYPFLVSQWLASQTGREVHILNLSRSGATVADTIAEQAPQMYRKEAVHVVTVCIGANNIRQYHAESFEKEMSLLIRMLPKGSFIATVPHFGGRVRKHDWKARAASEAVKRLVASTNHYCIDLYQETEKLGSARYRAVDMFHPNSRAYKKWAEAFEKAMAEHIPELVVGK